LGKQPPDVPLVPAGPEMLPSILSLPNFAAGRRGVAGRCSVAEVSPIAAAPRGARVWFINIRPSECELTLTGRMYEAQGNHFHSSEMGSGRI